MTPRLNRLAMAGGLAVLLFGCRSSTPQGNEAGSAAFPASIASAYALFTRKCSRCHPVSVPLLAPISSAEHWRRIVGRMRREPSSGISRTDAETILRFLTYHTEQRARRRHGLSSRGAPP